MVRAGSDKREKRGSAAWHSNFDMDLSSRALDARKKYATPFQSMLQRRGGLDQKMIEGLELTFSNRGVIRWNPF